MRWGNNHWFEWTEMPIEGSRDHKMFCYKYRSGIRSLPVISPQSLVKSLDHVFSSSATIFGWTCLSFQVVDPLTLRISSDVVVMISRQNLKGVGYYLDLFLWKAPHRYWMVSTDHMEVALYPRWRAPKTVLEIHSLWKRRRVWEGVVTYGLSFEFHLSRSKMFLWRAWLEWHFF